MPTKVYRQSYGFSSSYVCMWELDHKESWAPEGWWFWTVVLEKTLESPLDCKETKRLNSDGNLSWIFIGRADAQAEGSILWVPDEKNYVIGKYWCWIRLKVGGEGAGITDWMDMSLSKLRELVMDREDWHATVHGMPKSLTWLSNWTDWLEELRKKVSWKEPLHLEVPESWEEGRADMEEERQKYMEILDCQGGWRESIFMENRWQREAGYESGKN